MFAVLPYLTVAAVLTTGYANARPSEESLAVGFQLGLAFGDRLDKSAHGDKSAAAGDCRQRVADTLTEKTRAAGLLVERVLLAQLGDDNLRDKMCRLYAAESQALVECLIADEDSSSSAGRNPPMLRLLGAICDTYNNAIQRHAECISDVGGKMERECGVACRAQARNIVGDAAVARLSDTQVEDLCRVGLCVVRCVNAQLGECESESNGDTAGVEDSALAVFYERANALQALLGLEKSTRGAYAATPALLKAGKLPVKCHAFVRKASDDETFGTATVPAVMSGGDDELSVKSF